MNRTAKGSRVTIADVARRAGVSAGAVSFALNDRPGVAEPTRRRILDAAAELNWTPNARAKSLSQSKAFALGLVIARRPELLGADPFFPSFIAGVETVLAEAGQSLVLNMVATPAIEQETYRRLSADGRVDGVFVTDLRAGDERIALLAELALPAVTLGRPDVTSPHPAVCLDDAHGVAAAVRALIERGHRHIGHVGGPLTFLHSRSRRRAWAEELATAGLPANLGAVADFTAAGGAQATVQLLRRRPRPTALVYGNDVMAIAGIAVAQQHQLRVPADLSIVGFDDITLAEHLHPPLSSVRTDPFGWGQAATRVLLELIAGESPPDLELPAAAAVLRESIGDCPGQPTRKRSPRVKEKT
ncbi:LacI family transcriptional regulator [Jatrophihabitans telluris]|uniref:LacI family transcriptional regulator n=1 Tax=Jatrophihabitans telluris TaxID=2038343 RepID=A0ABY4R0N5_9ACTN|nr:LacI family DNA-binding transcriptional regulator [Jatrophihabitans telluris]UQX89072.1 LacI family transcriptional regulator [Jatrophihabitans telluris]